MRKGKVRKIDSGGNLRRFKHCSDFHRRSRICMKISILSKISRKNLVNRDNLSWLYDKG